MTEKKTSLMMDGWRKRIKEATKDPDKYVALMLDIAEAVRRQAFGNSRFGQSDLHNTFREFAQDLKNEFITVPARHEQIRNGQDFVLNTNALDNNSKPHPLGTEEQAGNCAKLPVGLVFGFFAPDIISSTIIPGNTTKGQSCLVILTTFHGFKPIVKK